ncbi:MAG: 1-acyl-sn-glycerol-3-phosphate acyltransferase [Pseudomonadota bacterium]
MSRPVTPWITRGVCRAAFFWLGMARHVRGQPMRGPGAAVANHASWLDIFALNAGDCLYFVAKAEVARWPGIGWLARATGTVFVRRAPREARSQADLLSARLTAGHRLLFFPEGTSTDGQRVLQFKTTLFAPLLSDDLNNDWQVQPITLKYVAPEVSDAAFYGWWGDMAFAGDLLKVLATPKQGHVEVIYHPAVRTSQMRDRKALAAWCEARVREGLEG